MIREYYLRVSSKITPKARNQSAILVELLGAIQEFRPQMLQGFFSTSNQSAFAIASDIQSGVLTEPKQEWLEAVEVAISDLEAITSSNLKRATNLAELGVTLREILDDIERYDNLPSGESTNDL
jgi:hypothetical protein